MRSAPVPRLPPLAAAGCLMVYWIIIMAATWCLCSQCGTVLGLLPCASEALSPSCEAHQLFCKSPLTWRPCSEIGGCFGWHELNVLSLISLFVNWEGVIKYSDLSYYRFIASLQVVVQIKFRTHCFSDMRKLKTTFPFIKWRFILHNNKNKKLFPIEKFANNVKLNSSLVAGVVNRYS